MAAHYTTIQGDTWDVIALRVYGSESAADYLMKNNLPYLDTFIFSAGVVLDTPGPPVQEDTALPSWRTAGSTLISGGDPYD